MPKQTTVLPLALPQRPAGAPAARWLGAALRGEILEGRLRPGARLPATRDLARQYQLSRGTVVSAFEQLTSEGYLVGAVGSGTYVNRVLPDELLQVRHRRAEPRDSRRAAAPRLSAFARRVRAFPADPFRPTRAFRSDLPALDLFPTTLWAQVSARRLRRATMQQLPRLGPDGLPAAAGSGGRLPPLVARRHLRARAGRHRLGAAGSPGCRLPAAARSGRRDLPREPGLHRCPAGVRGASGDHRARARGRRGNGAARPATAKRAAGLRHTGPPGAARHLHEPSAAAGAARVGPARRVP